MLELLMIPLQICPIAPGQAEKYGNQIAGMVLWGVIFLFGVAEVVMIGTVIVGKIMHQPHTVKAGIGGVVTVIVAAVALVVVVGIPIAIIGKGCIG
jgi:hypothetical protein